MSDVKLTVQQRLAVEDRGAAILVSAAAGSGKTKVLISRLLSYILDDTSPCNVDDFLIITYTKAAAAELRGKIRAEIENRLAADPEDRRLSSQLRRVHLAEISTIHAYCAGFLRTYGHHLGLAGDFRVAEEFESSVLQDITLEKTLDEVYEHLDRLPELQTLLDTLGLGRDDRNLKRLTLDFYQNLRNHADPDAWLEDCRNAFQFNSAADASSTRWGAYLIEEFQKFLDGQIQRMSQALSLLAQAPELGDACYALFERNIASLRTLRAYSTWQEISDGRITDFGRFPTIRNCGNPDIKGRVQRVRTVCWNALKRRQATFVSPSADVLAELTGTRSALEGLFFLTCEFAKRYEALKKQRNLLDFSDLEHFAIRLLTDRSTGAPKPVAREISAKYREILIDEYQDCNELQELLFQAVSRDGRNLFMVGDVKQSIYRFRLSDPTLFLRKYQSFAPAKQAGPGEPRKLLLCANFRSRPEILDAVNHVFSTVMSERVGSLRYGKDEALVPGVPFDAVDKPCVELHAIKPPEADEETSIRPDKRKFEAQYVARRIAELLHSGQPIRDGGEMRAIRPGDVTILMRSVSANAKEYIAALQAHGICCQSDRSSDILNTTEVCVLLALFKIIDNPHRDIPLVTVMASPLFAFSTEEMAKIREDFREDDLFDALCRYAPGRQKAEAFLTCLDELRTLSHILPLRELVIHTIRKTGVDSVFFAMPDGEVRRDNLRRFVKLCMDAEQTGVFSLSQLVSYLDMLCEKGFSIAPEAVEHGGSAVQIMSIHRAKGLEFPVVVLADLSHGFNLEDLRSPVLTDTKLMVGANVVDRVLGVQYPGIGKLAISDRMRRETLSEELRVLYVAMTRAKELLIMTYCDARLDDRISTICEELDTPVSPETAAGVRSMGEWVLMAALLRPEGRVLRPADTASPTVKGGAVWRIVRATLEDDWHARMTQDEAQNDELADVIPDTEISLSDLQSIYPHAAAVTAPAKLTATALKGRTLDAEAAEETTAAQMPRVARERRGRLTPAERGTALHQFLQFCDYAACRTRETLEAERARMIAKDFLTEEQAACLPLDKIFRFFTSLFAERMRNANQLEREFKFSILTDATEYEPTLSGEEVMLQGVVDCFFMEPDGIVILDFKTDAVMPGGETERACFYAPQIAAYAKALSKIYKTPVKECYLYFFTTEQLTQI